MNSRRQSMDGKIALVLAGGGMTGAVYEIGAMRAINDLMVDRTVNDFDIYVGTSAGAIVGSFLASGATPEEMFLAVAGQHPTIPQLRREHVFNLNQREFLRRSLALPAKLASTIVNYVRSPENATLVDAIWSLTDVLPSGLYDGMALERYMRQALTIYGAVNDFRAIKRELFVVATELDTGERAVFGADANSHVPISQAVAASTALPMVYKPVRIDGREYVDGGIRGTASLDIAIEHGATLVVCVNPLVPFDNAPKGPVETRPKEELFSRRGFSAVASQVSRIMTHSGLRYQIKQLRRQHPQVDIILIEPRPDDHLLAFGNIMRYAERLAIARHGFEAVTLDLAEDYYSYKEILARHDVPISRRLVIEELAEIRASGADPRVIERVLRARMPACAGAKRNSPACRLSQALADLEVEIDAFSARSAALAEELQGSTAAQQ